MAKLAAFACGVLFAVGLAIGGMTQASKVHDFLDVSGEWDPSLAFVLGGALLVHFAALKWILRRPRPVLAQRFQLPTRQDMDAPLVVGAVLFGAGWGLAGICPGPGITLLGSGLKQALIFVVAMSVAMVGVDRIRAARARN